MGPDGSLYIAGTLDERLRRVGPDGIITTMAGQGQNCPTPSCGDGGPALQAHLPQPEVAALGPDGSLYVADPFIARIRRVSSPLVGVSLTDIVIPSTDGSELYVFDGTGRHLRTLDALTGALHYSFSYDGAGRLVAVTDAYSNTTPIVRDGTGAPSAIVAPGGQTTTLTLDANGYMASIADPLGHTVMLTSTVDGLLTNLTDPNGHTHTFAYDSLGRLSQDQDPAGGMTTLARLDASSGYTVTATTALSRTTTYVVAQLPTGDQRRTVVDPSGARTEALIHADGSRTLTSADGTIVTQTLGPDPRWGMLAPVVSSQQTSTPGGLTQTLATTRSAALANPIDPLSLQVLTSTLTINGRTALSVYTAATRTFTVTSAAGRQSVTTLDAYGRLASATLAPGMVSTNWSYDAQGRLHQVQQGDQSLTYEYDAGNRLSTRTDAAGHTVQYQYDAADRVITTTLPSGLTYGFSYDANGNSTGVVMPSHASHTFTYTPLDQLASYTPPGSGSALWSYNLDRAQTGLTLPSQRTMTTSYDPNGRVSGLSEPDATVSFAYTGAAPDRASSIALAPTVGLTQAIGLARRRRPRQWHGLERRSPGAVQVYP